MYKNLVNIHKNTITINDTIFRKILKKEENHDKIIEYIIQLNKKILKKYKKFNYIISTKTISVYDIYYLEFFKELILRVQSVFKEELESICLTDTSEIFKYVFSYISVFIKPDIMDKIHFS